MDWQTDGKRDGDRKFGTNEDGRTDFPHRRFYGLFCPISIFAFKGCGWRLIPAHPHTDWRNNGIVDFISFRYSWPRKTFFRLVFYYSIRHHIFCLQGMLLATYSSAPSICWLAWQWGSRICLLMSFIFICLSPHKIFPLDFNHIFLHQIFRLQGIQLTTDSSTPSVSWLSWG